MKPFAVRTCWTLIALALLVSADTPAAAQTPTPVAAASRSHWIGAWATAAQPHLPSTLQRYENQTVRLIVHTTVGGQRVRIRISNRYGTQSLRIGAAHIARRASGAAIDERSDRSLRFSGRTSVTVPPRATVTSDPVHLDVSALSDLAVSLYFPERTEATTSHTLALQTSYVSGVGDVTAATSFVPDTTTTAWPFLTGVDVESPRAGYSIVAFGSSTTDGDGTTADANRRWPDALATRLQQHAVNDGRIGVLNLGIIGNRLLADSPTATRDRFGAALGESGLARFQRDVIDQPGVRVVFICLGVNDISFPGVFTPELPRPSAADIVAGYERLIARARRRNIRVIGTTITPFEGARSFTAAKDSVRQAVNAWIRSGRAFDAVVDFDAAVRDERQPSRLRPDFDSGDHLHANDAGHTATANAIPLALLDLRRRP